jgi:hypothetical protein
MEVRTRDLLFGTGRSKEHLAGTFAPPGWTGAGGEKGSILSTFKGFGSAGKGRDRVLGAFERSGMISAEQRAAGGAVGDAADGVAAATRNLVNSGGAAAAGAASVAPQAAQQYANPVYGGLYAQMMMRDQGFVAPLAASEPILALADDIPAAAVADDASSTIASAADDIAADLVGLEQRWQASLERLLQLPADQQLPAVARAVDATAVAGHTDDAFGVLGAALEARPLEHVAPALEHALADLAHVAPVVDDAAKVAAKTAPLVDDVVKAAAPLADDVAKATAPLIDDVVKAASAAVPKVVETALPAASALASRSLLLGSSHALQGVMPFSAGVDDTIRLLARF